MDKDEKIPVWYLTGNMISRSPDFTKIEELLEEIKFILEENPEESLEIGCHYMTVEDYNKLPEWQGY